MRFIIAFCLFIFSIAAWSQPSQKQLTAQRATGAIKIDGEINEAAWKDATAITDLIEFRPDAGKKEDSSNKTVLYLLYDNTSIYVAGYCYEKTKDSISKELVGRDKLGASDYVGAIFDTYNDKINGSGFFVTPYGEQFDAKYSSGGNEDENWNAVWDSEAKINDNGWSFEMRIPYSALRFNSTAGQTWGLNFIRKRNKAGKQYSWNFLDPKVNGLMNQGGLWTGIEKIEAPVRLSFSPYLSSYVNHYPGTEKKFKSSVNGGMDVKYGINESFTLDMTLIPDFGQVRSDNQVLNLSPFEVRFNENRSFFTEGTELFNKGNLFYSRRVGSMPINFGNAFAGLQPGERIVKNPTESKLLNATKISGRTKSGLGIGVFNAVTKEMFAEIETANKEIRKVQTAPVTNYNILVFDQSLKNNSSVSLVNTNVLRNGPDYDANVTAALFNLNDKKNMYNVGGKVALSQKSHAIGNHTNGYSHEIRFGKQGGNWMFNVYQELADAKYNINDMGIMNNNNFLEHGLWTGYRWNKPKNWYNRIGLNYNAGISRRFNPSSYQIFYTNINGNAQLKNLWFVGAFIGLNAAGNDYYEPRMNNHAQGINHYFFRSERSMRYNAWVETNSAKKYSGGGNIFYASTKLFYGKEMNFNIWQKYRFNDKFSLQHELYLGPSMNEAGFYRTVFDANGKVEDIIFSRRNRSTIENTLNAKYNFNNRSGITFRARNYWSQVRQQQLYDLQADGRLKPTDHFAVALEDRNFNVFTIDAEYTLQFAPGSFINVVWKDQSQIADNDSRYRYQKNLSRVLSAPQNNNLSVKVIYFLDYLDLKKWRKKG